MVKADCFYGCGKTMVLQGLVVGLTKAIYYCGTCKRLFIVPLNNKDERIEYSMTTYGDFSKVKKEVKLAVVTDMQRQARRAL